MFVWAFPKGFYMISFKCWLLISWWNFRPRGNMRLPLTTLDFIFQHQKDCIYGILEKRSWSTCIGLEDLPSPAPDTHLRLVSNTFLQLQYHIGLVSNTRLYLQHTQSTFMYTPLTHIHVMIWKIPAHFIFFNYTVQILLLMLTSTQ